MANLVVFVRTQVDLYTLVCVCVRVRACACARVCVCVPACAISPLQPDRVSEVLEDALPAAPRGGCSARGGGGGALGRVRGGAGGGGLGPARQLHPLPGGAQPYPPPPSVRSHHQGETGRGGGAG